MKFTNSAMLGFALTVGLAACSNSSADDAANETINAAMQAAANADAAIARADAVLAGVDKTDAKKTNGGMGNIDLKTSAEMNLKGLLKDADSVKYRDVFLSRIEGGNLMLCGKVNSKNSFGGYTGFKRFIASPNPDAPTLIEGEASGMGAAVDAAFPQAYAEVCSNPVERF